METASSSFVRTALGLVRRAGLSREQRSDMGVCLGQRLTRRNPGWVHTRAAQSRVVARANVFPHKNLPLRVPAHPGPLTPFHGPHRAKQLPALRLVTRRVNPPCRQSFGMNDACASFRRRAGRATAMPAGPFALGEGRRYRLSQGRRPGARRCDSHSGCFTAHRFCQGGGQRRDWPVATRRCTRVCDAMSDAEKSCAPVGNEAGRC